MAKKKNRRPRYSPTKPLELTGEVDLEELVAQRVPRRLAWLDHLVRVLPAYASDKDGRRTAAMIKLGMGALSVFLITQSRESPGLGVLAILIALTTIVLPMSDVRKHRWQQQVHKRKQPRVKTRPAPCELHFDGKKLVIRAEARVWRSLRPNTPPCDITVRHAQHHTRLGLRPTAGKQVETLWFETRDNIAKVYQETTGPDLSPGPTCRVTGEAFVTIHRAFIAPPRSPSVQATKS